MEGSYSKERLMKSLINVVKESKMFKDHYKTSLATTMLAYWSMQYRIPEENIERIESQHMYTATTIRQLFLT